VADYRDGQKSPPGRRVPLSDLGPIAALQPGELYVVDDLTQLPSPPPLMQRMIQAGSRASVDAPLIVLGRQIGLLSLDARLPHHFSAGAIEVVREVADQLAVAIQNARLLDQTRRHAQELELRVAERTRELASQQRLTEPRPAQPNSSAMSRMVRTPIAN
jgi:GAF domain-containing protein